MCLGVSATAGGRPVCCGEEAVADAGAVCDRLGIPHQVLDYSSRLEREVVGPFIAEYAAGRTPNPCVDCNLHLKFGALLDTALALGFDALATGHYAGVVERGGRPELVRGRDRAKDQSYFLALVPAERLRRVIFPLAGLEKAEVRRLAGRAGLPVSEKPESQDVCFIAGDYREFLRGRGVSFDPGPIVDTGGRTVGTHSGLPGYTVGQRDGLGISSAHPLYVLGKDVGENLLRVGPREALAATGLEAGRVNVFVDPLPEDLTARVRHRGRETGCRAWIEEGRLRVRFREETSGIAPGQVVALYHGDRVVAAGVIERSWAESPG
jgi:tRNA-specific 2-thiouridylase